MNETPLPEWDDRDTLLNLMTGEWQFLPKPLDQTQRLLLAEYVVSGFLEFRFKVDIVCIEDARLELQFNVVVSGDYSPFLQPQIQAAANDLMPTGYHLNMTRQLSAVRRTTLGAIFVEAGCPSDVLEVRPPELRVCDVRMGVAPAEPENGPANPQQDKVPAPPGDSSVAAAQVNTNDSDANEHQGSKDVSIRFMGLQLDVARRKLLGDDGHSCDLDPVQAAVIGKFLASGESWLSSATIERVISATKSRPGMEPYSSADVHVVSRTVSQLRGILSPFSRTIKNDRHGGYRIEEATAEPTKPLRKKSATRRNTTRKKGAS